MNQCLEINENERDLQNDTAKALLIRLKQEKERLIKEKLIINQKSFNFLNDDEVPFTIPQNWIWVRLFEVSIIQEGPGIRKYQYQKEGIQFLTVTNILEGAVDLEKSKKYISLKEFNDKYNHFKINKNDIVTACSGGSWGKSAIFNCDDIVILNTSTLRLRFFGDLGDNKYLYYLTKAGFFKTQIAGQLSGQQPNFGYSHYSRIQIPIPPIHEQKRIVKILDGAFAAIEKAKANAVKNLQNSRELFDSYLNKVFANPGEDWVEKMIRELGVVQTGTTPKTSQRENFGSYIPFVKPADFNSDGSICYNTEGLSEIGLKNSRHIDENSTLMVCIGATIGKTGFTEKSISCNQQINSLTTKAEYYPKFFYHAMLTKSFQAEVKKNSGQATLPIINKTKWSNLTLRFPKGKEHQEQLSGKFDKLTTERKKLEAIYQQKHADLEELKKSILQKAFDGNL